MHYVFFNSRMRDIARTQMCTEYVKKFAECTQREGFKMVATCRDERDALCHCIEKWFYDPDFKESVIEEYLNERSHFRETGIKTKRYQR